MNLIRMATAQEVEEVTKEAMPDLGQLEDRWRYIMATMIMGDLFVHEFLMMMSKVADPMLPTMGVCCKGTRIMLRYNPFFLQKLTDEQVRWVLHHEVLHVALHHCTLRQPTDPRQQTLWNWAADLAVNQLIKESSVVVRPDAKDIKPLTPDMFGFPEMLSMEQYLQLLWKWDEENRQNQQDQEENSDSDGDDSDQGESSGDGEQGSSDNNSKSSAPQAPKGGQVVDDHSGFEESDIMDQVIRTKVEQMLNQAKYWGHMSGNAKQAIEAAQRAHVNWRKQLRHQYGRYVIDEKEPTILRPNRRFGYPYTGTTNVCVDRVLVCWDTSGSVSDRALSQFVAETNRAKEHVPIDLLQFDHSIQYGPKPFDKKVKRMDAEGRGGTRFTPAFELADKKRYKAMVILTDGEAEAPPRPKHVRDILWCIVRGGKPPVDWGRVIHIKDNWLR